MAVPRRRSALIGHLQVTPGSLGSQEDILQALRRTILDGGVAPGAPIPVEEVAEVFGVSRIPVREALKTLIGEGLVAHRARSGYTIAQLTVEEFQEIYVVRGVLERAALGAAVVVARAVDDEEVTAAHQALGRALALSDLPGYHRESRRFHVALMVPSRMPRLLHMIDSAWNITEPCRPMAHVSADARRELHHDHDAMMDCFHRRDLAGLLDAAAIHQQRLESSIATLPRHTGLFVELPS